MTALGWSLCSEGCKAKGQDAYEAILEQKAKHRLAARQTHWVLGVG